MSDNEQKGRSGSGGYDPGPVDRMATFRPVFKIRYVVHSVGNLKIGREVTIGQLFGAAVGFLICWFLMRVFVTTGWPSLAAGAAGATLVTRGLALVEDAGRPPYVEIYRFLSFAFFSSRYYRGARKVGGKLEKERLEEMFAQDRAKETGGTREKSAVQVLKDGIADVGRTVSGGGGR